MRSSRELRLGGASAQGFAELCRAFEIAHGCILGGAVVNRALDPKLASVGRPRLDDDVVLARLKPQVAVKRPIREDPDRATECASRAIGERHALEKRDVEAGQVTSSRAG